MRDHDAFNLVGALVVAEHAAARARLCRHEAQDAALESCSSRTMPRMRVAILSDLGLTEETVGDAWDRVYLLGALLHRASSDLRLMQEQLQNAVAELKSLADAGAEGAETVDRQGLCRAIQQLEPRRSPADDFEALMAALVQQARLAPTSTTDEPVP